VRATVAVTDIGAAAAFYEGTTGLGSEPGEAMDQVRIYACGASTFVQVYVSEHAGTAGATVASPG
jgi:hypothetical protein